MRVEEARTATIVNMAKTEAEKCVHEIKEQIFKELKDVVVESMEAQMKKKKVMTSNDDLLERVNEIYDMRLSSQLDATLQSRVEKEADDAIKRIFSTAIPQVWMHQMEQAMLPKLSQMVSEGRSGNMDGKEDVLPAVLSEPSIHTDSSSGDQLSSTAFNVMKLTVSELQSELQMEKSIRLTLEKRLKKLETYVDFDGTEWVKTKSSVRPQSMKNNEKVQVNEKSTQSRLVLTRQDKDAHNPSSTKVMKEEQAGKVIATDAFSTFKGMHKEEEGMDGGHTIFGEVNIMEGIFPPFPS